MYNIYRHVAITTSSFSCAKVGKNILDDGGSIADAAIACLLCGGVRNPERMGIGGGFIMTMYNNTTKTVDVLVARERAPKAATKNMYDENKYFSLFGGLACAVPGSLRGYWELHQKYGKLPWEKLFESAITLCEQGVEVEPCTSNGLRDMQKRILKSQSLRKILVDTSTGLVKRKKEIIFRPILAKTLRLVAQKGPDVLYNGELTEPLVNDINKEGGKFHYDDMASYKAEWMEPISLKFGKYTIYTAPPPSSGAVLLLILNILSVYKDPTNSAQFWYKIIEAWKFAFGYRSKLGDPQFVKNIHEIVEEMLSNDTAARLREKIENFEISNNFKDYGGTYYVANDTGTAHCNLVSKDGDAIAVTESINTLFGAMFKSLSTGIIMNNCMNDFCFPKVENNFNILPSEPNFIEPGKFPLSSTCPVIVLDEDGHVKLCTGAAGGAKIITALSTVIYNHLLMKMNVSVAVNEMRLHHQLMPMRILYEPTFSQEILVKLEEMGYFLTKMQRLSAVGIISKENAFYHAKGDIRRYSGLSGY